MTKIVDARGLACPQPVLQTRNALQKHPTLVTIVDNETAQHNVTRMAEQAGCKVSSEAKDDGIYLHIDRGDASDQTSVATATMSSQPGPQVLLVGSEHMGQGAPELGSILMRGLFHTLGEIAPLPQTILFINSGVKLVVQDSPVLQDLQALGDSGIQILACGTCLGYYELKDQVAVGEVTNMYTIAETLLQAEKVTHL